MIETLTSRTGVETTNVLQGSGSIARKIVEVAPGPN